MKNFASIKPLLYIQKTLKNGKHPIVLQLIKDRKVRRIGLGYSASLKEWDIENNKPSNRYPFKQELENLIRHKVSALSKEILAMDTADKTYTAEMVIEKVKKKRRAISVMKYFDEIIASLKETNRIGTAEHYQTCKNVIYTFNRKRDLGFIDIDFTFLTRFENHYKAKGGRETTIASYMRTLRAAYNRAIKETIVPAEVYPFKDYKIGKLNTMTPKRAIKEEHIRSIENLELDINSRLNRSRNIFLFSFYTMGTNLVDIANLSWDSIKDDRLKYERAKTHKHYNIVLTGKAKEIIDYYANQKSNKYVFPIYEEDTHLTANQRNNRLHKVLIQTNKDLKIIAEKCNISENLTTYVARHSAATILKRKGVSTTIISELLGHETEEITQTYLDSFESPVLDTAVAML